MEKALLEEHVRYGEARFRDKELVRPFVNRIYQDLAKLEEAMKPKTCEGCRHYDEKQCTNENSIAFGGINAVYKDDFCNDFEPKANA